MTGADPAVGPAGFRELAKATTFARERFHLAYFLRAADPLLITKGALIEPVLALAVAAMGARAQEPANRVAAAVDSAARIIAQLANSQALPGWEAVVARRGHVLWSATGGFADLQTRRPVTRATRFRVGSVSKLFTATAMARLYTRGELDVDAPVQKYVPEFPAAARPITPLLLVGHLSGIRHYGRSDYVNRTHYAGVRAALARFAGDSLVALPGTRYAYSSYGFNLLGAVLEAASGAEFRDLLRRSVFAPLRMTGTVVEDGTPWRDVARPYMRADSTIVPADSIDLSDRWPSGGVLSTAEDMALFGRSLSDSAFLPTRDRERMLTPQHTSSGDATTVGWGWRIGRDPQGRRIAHHGGDAMGGRAFVLVYPDEQLVVTFVTNLSFARFDERTAMAVAAPFLAAVH
jgi:CubicO group peptidase (beta-lactamase class C family)